MSSLALAPQQMAIYVGFSLFITGVVGGFLVLVVFLSLQTFRQSSCAFYLTIKSIVNILCLFLGLLPFIMSVGFGISWANASVAYCKVRIYHVELGSLISVTCTWLAALDQFLATCSNPRYNRWNTVKVARNVVIAVVIVLALYEMPALIYYDHTQSSITGRVSCSSTNTAFQRFRNVFHGPVMTSSLPSAIMTVFGLLAYRNVRNIAYRAVPLVRRELDKQLTSMVLVEVVYDVIFVPMIMIQTIFNAIVGTPTDLYTVTMTNFIRNLTTLLYYFTFVVCTDIHLCERILNSFRRVHSTYMFVSRNDFVNNLFM